MYQAVSSWSASSILLFSGRNTLEEPQVPDEIGSLDQSKLQDRIGPPDSCKALEEKEPNLC